MQADVIRALVERQLADVRELAQTNGWEVEADFGALTVEVRMQSPIDGEEYVVRFDCTGYDEKPPYVEMVHPETGEVGHYEATSMTGGRIPFSSRPTTGPKIPFCATSTTDGCTTTTLTSTTTGRWESGSPTPGI